MTGARVRVRYFYALAVAVTIAGGYVIWTGVVAAACPSQEEVAAALEAQVEPESIYGLFDWPPGVRVRVRGWEFFGGYPVRDEDRVVLRSYAWRDRVWIDRRPPGSVVARPVTAFSRLRLWIADLPSPPPMLFGRKWIAPDRAAP